MPIMKIDAREGEGEGEGGSEIVLLGAPMLFVTGGRSTPST